MNEEIKPKISYIVESLFYRKNIGNKLDFLLNNGDLKDAIHLSKKEFKDESPIIARENAFNHFQSIVDVLYDGLDKKYTTDEQARIDLQKYLDSGNAVELLGNNPRKKNKITDDILNGIEIYLVIETPLENNKEKPFNKVLIHGIRYIDYPERVDEGIIESLEGLIKENHYYQDNSYSTKDYITFLILFQIGGTVEPILKTPFDWNSFMKKHEGKALV